METVEIKCLKSILNVAERAKKAKNAIYQALERVRDEGAAGSNPVIPTIKKSTHRGAFFYARREDLNLKKARAVKKRIDNCFQASDAKYGTEMRSIWVYEQDKREADVSCHPDHEKRHFSF